MGAGPEGVVPKEYNSPKAKYSVPHTSAAMLPLKILPLQKFDLRKVYNKALNNRHFIISSLLG